MEWAVAQIKRKEVFIPRPKHGFVPQPLQPKQSVVGPKTIYWGMTGWYISNQTVGSFYGFNSSDRLLVIGQLRLRISR